MIFRSILFFSLLITMLPGCGKICPKLPNAMYVPQRSHQVAGTKIIVVDKEDKTLFKTKRPLCEKPTFMNVAKKAIAEKVPLMLIPDGTPGVIEIEMTDGSFELLREGNPPHPTTPKQLQGGIIDLYRARVVLTFHFPHLTSTGDQIALTQGTDVLDEPSPEGEEDTLSSKLIMDPTYNETEVAIKERLGETVEDATPPPLALQSATKTEGDPIVETFTMIRDLQVQRQDAKKPGGYALAMEGILMDLENSLDEYLKGKGKFLVQRFTARQREERNIENLMDTIKATQPENINFL